MPQMTDDQLTRLLSRLKEDSAILLSSEDATKQGAILPILTRLGWDSENVGEVVPEYRVGGGRVDYCLRIRDKSLAFIEAKRADQELGCHQEQLLDYAFREGVELATLTNGVVWWLYLPLLGGSWEQRKFFTIDILEQGAEIAAGHFRSFLAKSEVVSGSAALQARELHRSREKERLTFTTLPKAWQLLCHEPDEILADLMASKVESLCGHRPTPDQVAQFLQQATSAPADAADKNRTPHRSSSLRHAERTAGSGAPTLGYTFTRPASFTLFGVTHRTSSWSKVLVGVCEAMASKYPREFEGVIQLKGRKLDYFAHDLRGMQRPELIPGTDIYVETNLSANDSMKRCGRVLRLFGHSQESLQVQTQPLR